MKAFNIHEAKTNLSHLIALMQGGEEVVICKSGKPVASLNPIVEKKETPKFGEYEGQVWMDPNTSWEDMDTEIVEMFEDGMNEDI